MSRYVSDISVITVNWNGLLHLQSLLPSLTGLGCREILVVDNGSSDGSLDFLRRQHPRVRILQNSDNRGFAHPCNQGAAAAEGNLLAFINNDMRADPDWLAQALPLLSPQQPCVASRILDWSGQHIDYNGSSLHYLGYALQKDIGALLEEVTAGTRVLFPCGGAMLVDREFFLQIGGFDESFFAIYEDVDLGWRTWLMGKQVGYAAASIVYHRGHSTFRKQQTHRTRYLMHRNALLTIVKNYEEEFFLRIFPVALMEAVRRAIYFSGVDRSSFYLWERTEAALAAGDPAVDARLLDALNHLVALDDVISDLPRVLAERARIQSRRQRPDSEILSLFEDPFRHIVEDPDYLAEEARLLRRLGLDRLFTQTPDPVSSRTDDDLGERIVELRRELARLQYWGQRQLDHPAPPAAPGPRDFLRTWKREGLAVAWQRFREYVDRGL